MIAVYGRLDDPPVSLLIDALQEASLAYCLLDIRSLGDDEIRLPGNLDGGCRGRLRVAGQQWPLADFHSVYARPLDPPCRGVGAVRAAAAQRFSASFVDWLDGAQAFVVSRPRAMLANASKPLQAQWIGDGGFRVPPTLVTNDEAEARAFWREHGRVVFKSTSGVRSIVQELDECSAARLPLLGALPVQFQAWVPGVDLRVHVVGKRTFAAEIRSGATDYRYAGASGAAIELAAVELPNDVALRCIELSLAMELPLSGIDLRRRPDGEYVCFEVNPMPAYSYYESQTGLPISHALAQLLHAGRLG